MSRIANLIADALVRGDFTNCFTKPVSALACAEPIVVLESAFERASRADGEERGVVPVSVLVVREGADEAESVAIACERLLRGGLERGCEVAPWRVVGVDTSAPRFDRRDSSGRHVWRFEADVTVVRSV